VKYAANLSAGESYIDIGNTGAYGEALFGPGIISGLNVATGNLCVNVYAIDPAEELVSCCSCLVTPGQVVHLGVNSDLVSSGHTTTGVVPSSAFVKLIGTLAGPTGASTSCTNSAALAGAASFPLAVTGGMVAWGTTLHQAPGSGLYLPTETPFTPAFLNQGFGGTSSELASLTGRCAFIIGDLGGYGICSSCSTGALGASKM
jgi:hypothetical protein